MLRLARDQAKLCQTFFQREEILPHASASGFPVLLSKPAAERPCVQPVVHIDRRRMVIAVRRPSVGGQQIAVQIPTLVKVRRRFAIYPRAARALSETGASPGGHPRHFCDALKAASTPHSSTRTGHPPSVTTVSSIT